MRTLLSIVALLLAGCGGKGATHPPSGIPQFTTVFVVVMENTSWSTLQSAIDMPAATTPTPFLKQLAATAATASNYHGVAHPSLPNYLAMISGDTQGIGCDCDPAGDACDSSSCNLVFHSCSCGNQSARHIGDQLERLGKRWRSYAENLSAPCDTATVGSYAARHVPFVYFKDVVGDCRDRVADYSALASDLPDGLPALAFITPNLTDDMHDPVFGGATNLANGDSWLATAVPTITASDAFQRGGVLFIVWDEDDLSGLQAADDPIPLFVLSPLARQNGYVNPTHADHYSLLATIENGLGIDERLGHAAAASPLTDFFAAP